MVGLGFGLLEGIRTGYYGNLGGGAPLACMLVGPADASRV